MSEKEDIKGGRLIYTCNCGWLDLGHAFKQTDRPYVSAASLWKQIVDESGPRSRQKDPPGFLVTYKQDMGRVIPPVSVPVPGLTGVDISPLLGPPPLGGWGAPMPPMLVPVPTMKEAKTPAI